MSSKKNEQKVPNLVKLVHMSRPLAIVVAVIVLFGLFIGLKAIASHPKQNSLATASVRSIDSQITADGAITAQNQAALNFQTAGKLVYLPFKEGDTVYQGQTIAQLDTYSLQRQLTQALNNYRLNRDTFDQSKQNQNNGVLLNEQQATLKTAGSGIGPYGTDTGSTSYIDDLIKRLADQNQANLDNTVINVELANYALQLSTLTSPLNGIVTHEDVKVPFINITSTTSFTVEDPSTAVFRANIPPSLIDYVELNNNAMISIDGNQNKVSGTVVKIFPTKITVNGENVYQVDIQSDSLLKIGKLDQPGTVVISTNANNVVLVKSWTVLGGKYLWVERENKPQLIQIVTGKTHGDDIEIVSGLNFGDKIITDPKTILNGKYQIL